MIYRGLFGMVRHREKMIHTGSAVGIFIGKLSSLNLLITNALSGQTKLGGLSPEGLNLSWDETQLLQYNMYCGIRIRGASQIILSRLTHNNISRSNPQHEAGHYKSKALNTDSIAPCTGGVKYPNKKGSLPSTHVPFELYIYKVPWYRSGKEGSTAPQLNSSGKLEGGNWGNEIWLTGNV